MLTMKDDPKYPREQGHGVHTAMNSPSTTSAFRSAGTGIIVFDILFQGVHNSMSFEPAASRDIPVLMLSAYDYSLKASTCR